MATNIPPHNLGELCDAVMALIKNPNDLSDEALLKIVPGPDFPTGGKIMGSAGARQLYVTGKGSLFALNVDVFSSLECLPGSIVIRGTCHNEIITSATKQVD